MVQEHLHAAFSDKRIVESLVSLECHRFGAVLNLVQVCMSRFDSCCFMLGRGEFCNEFNCFINLLACAFLFSQFRACFTKVVVLTECLQTQIFKGSCMLFYCVLVYLIKPLMQLVLLVYDSHQTLECQVDPFMLMPVPSVFCMNMVRKYHLALLKQLVPLDDSYCRTAVNITFQVLVDHISYIHS